MVATNPDLERALRELRDAQPSYQEAEDQYEGTVPEWFGSAKLRRALERTGVHWKLPFAGIVVDAVRDRMELQAVTSSDEDVAAWLEEAWTANQMDAESDDVTQWGLVYGESYALVWTEADDEESGSGLPSVSIHYNSPRVMRLFYDEETGRTKRFAAKVWLTSQDRTRVNLYYDDRVEKYESKGKRAKTSGDFERFVDVYTEPEEEGEDREEVWPIPHEFGEVPVFHFRTERPHGRPEHERAYSPQAMVNKLVIGLMSANDFQGFPQRWALSGTGLESTGEFEDDDLEFLESGEDPEAGKEEVPSLKSGPGELWWLPGVEKVGQFDPADVEAFLKPLRMLLEAMGSLTRTPTDFFLSAEGSAPSGESRRVAHAPLTKKVKDRKQNHGATWEELWSFAAMIGLGLRERPQVAITWAPSESYDDGDSWTVAQRKQEAGVPKKRTLVEQGYAQDEVDEWYPENEADEAAVDQLSERVALLTQLADAAQKLGMASQFGVVTPEQVQELMATLIPEAAEPEGGE